MKNYFNTKHFSRMKIFEDLTDVGATLVSDGGVTTTFERGSDCHHRPLKCYLKYFSENVAINDHFQA